MNDANAERLVILVIALAVLGSIVALKLQAQSPASPALPTLTQLSANEYVDLTKLALFRHSYFIDLSTCCGGDAQYPVSALMIVGGQQASLSTDGEIALRRLFGQSVSQKDIQEIVDVHARLNTPAGVK